jgi:DNA-binding beta-propeller fold protein YncE
MGNVFRSAVLWVLLAIAGTTPWSGSALAQSGTPDAGTGLPDCGAAAAPASPVATPPVPSTPPPTSGSSILETVADVPLPGDASRFDYQSLDPTTGRLYLAHMDAGQVVVFDTRTRKVVGTVGDLPTVTGVLVVPEVGRVYAAVAGNHQVAAIAMDSLTVVARVGTIGFPDGLAYAPQAQQVYVSDESGGGELVIDAATNAVVTTIDIGGEAGNTQYDTGSGCIVVAVQSRNELVAIDPRRDEVVGRYPLTDDCQTPHGFTLDAAARRAFVSCEDNATLLVVDLTTMRVTGTFPVGDGPDVLDFDAGWQRLYVASESGTVSVFDEGNGTLTPTGEYKAPHAHSVAVDPATHLVYLPLENVDGRPVLRIMAAPAPAD